MNFGGGDEILETAADITATTVTWRWREAENTNLKPSDAAPYLGYIIKYSVDQNTWHDNNRIPFQVTGDLWQAGRVTGLQPDTQYWFDIVVYRIYTGGILYNSTNTARGMIGQYLTARTKPVTGVTRKYYNNNSLFSVYILKAMDIFGRNMYNFPYLFLISQYTYNNTAFIGQFLQCTMLVTTSVLCSDCTARSTTSPRTTATAIIIVKLFVI